MRAEILEKLTELLQNEDVRAINTGVNDAIRSFRSLLSDEQLVAKPAEEEQTEEELAKILEDRKIDTKIEELIVDFKDRRKAFKKKKEEEEKANLIAKKAILTEFKDLVENEENIGAAFAKKKEIQQRWKELGNVPKDKFEDIQSQYSKLNDFFNYNINIYKEIQEHDLKRNYSLKNKIIFDLKALLEEKSIKKTQSALNQFLTDWDEIGPTFQEKWEELKNEFWGTVNELRTKIRSFYSAQAEKLEKNLEVKQELIERSKEFVTMEADSIKGWNSATEKALALQGEWKKTGPVTKDKNKEVWEEFRLNFDAFFGKKNDYFKGLKKDNSKNQNRKKEIVAKAEEMKMSDDWKNTTLELKKLQGQWKEIGHTGRGEQKLWEQFRSACDFYFNNKKEYFANRESIEAGNIEKKQAVIKEISEFKLPDNSNDAIQKLKEFSTQFLEIGNVPFKQKDIIYGEYKSALDKHYDSLKLDRKQKTRINYKNKLDGMVKKGNSNTITKERDYLKRKLTNLNNEIGQYENNMGFFGNSKGAEQMKADIQKKIDKSKLEIETIRQKLKLIKDV
ncbi:MAG: DUF349 domain-containing protein [Flavobacteriales bacterium]|tara:strand:- start:1452 stop:3140 length:1689 start_codon:yes stop_codon:yes gene_type:complete